MHEHLFAIAKGLDRAVLLGEKISCTRLEELLRHRVKEGLYLELLNEADTGS